MAVSMSQFNPKVDPAARREAGVSKWTRYPAEVLPAWVAETDFAPLPEIVEAVRSVADTALFGYAAREDRLVEACIGWMERRHDWEIDPELVMPLDDVMQGVEMAVTALSEPGDGVVVTTPVYFPFFKVSPSAGRRQVEWPLRRGVDGWKFHVDDLERILDQDPSISVILLSHPHNPTGRVMDRSTMDEVVRIAAAHDVMIVSDEIHCDLVYPGARHHSMLTAAGATDRVVVATSATKTFAISGLRASVLVFGSPDVKQRCVAAHPPFLLGHVNTFGADATSAAWEFGDEYADGLLAHLVQMRAKLIDRIAAEAPAVRFHPPAATFLAWLDVSACDLGENPSKRILKSADVAVQGGELFGTGGDQHLRLNFATSAEILDEILDRMIPHLQR